MSTQPQGQHLPSTQTTFQSLYHKRISSLQQKVNKYCAQYDSLMSLLPIGNNFESVLNFQADVVKMNEKIDMADEKVAKINQKEIDVDRGFWERQLKELENVLKNNQKQIQLVEKLQQTENCYDDSLSFEEHLNEKLKNHCQVIQSKLANHKNNIELKKRKQSAQSYGSVSSAIDKKIDSFFNPIQKELEQIEEEISISRLKIPQREIKNFHDFNYHRLLNEILEINQEIEQLFSLCNTQDPNLQKELKSKVIEIDEEIQSIHYQIQGSKKKCLNDLMAHQFLHNNSYKHDSSSLDKKVKTDFELLQNNLFQVKSKLLLIKKSMSSNN